jgi:hypothetical protein
MKCGEFIDNVRAARSEEERCLLGLAVRLRNKYTTIRLFFRHRYEDRWDVLRLVEIGTGHISAFCGPDVECKSRWYV